VRSAAHKKHPPDKNLMGVSLYEFKK